MFRHALILNLVLLLAATGFSQRSEFLTVKDGQFSLNNKPYYFIGTNYWYGSLLGLEKDKARGIERLRTELDFLKKQGVTNLRLMAGAEGSGLLNNVHRVGPPLQLEQGNFDASTLDGLDIVLAEMAKRRMKAVIFLSNNWEWSGGFQQYLIWNKVIPDRWLKEKPTWDQLRDNVSKFYSCPPCKEAFAKQVEYVIARKNKLNGKLYAEDGTIMAWEIANEPRPMRPAANEAYKTWIAETAGLIKRLDPNHLVTTGHEGRIGTESLKIFEEIHTDANVDYLTIHIWPKNWGWFENGKMAEGFQKALYESVKYIEQHSAVAVRLKKPLVIEEFGLPRDGQSFAADAPTTFRDRYFRTVFSFIRTYPNIAGANFWAFGGTARPIEKQVFWKEGDEYMGDPPMEEQGLYSVFDGDESTWNTISEAVRSLKKESPQ
jgi:mannan endo-1,4-beta-mannosidase